MKNDFSEKSFGGVPLMLSNGLADCEGVIHAFTTRAGGVSSGVYYSLNLGFNRGDDPDNVRENYNILTSALGLDAGRLVCSHQVHGDTVRVATAADCREDPASPINYDADALVTNEQGLAIMVFAADCIPILLYAGDTHAVGAAHAGWRGTVADIAGKTAMKMCSKYGGRPENIRAAIGAGIGLCCFETGAEVYEAAKMLELPKLDGLCREDGGGKYHVDLKGINRALLVRAGLREENIAVNPECTMCLCDKYWSHRATNGVRGIQGAVIALRNTGCNRMEEE